MPSLEEVLKRHRVAYSIFEVPTRGDSARAGRHRTAWALVAGLGLVWGLLTGLALALDTFFLHPALALYGALGVAVLGTTTFVHGLKSDRAEGG